MVTKYPKEVGQSLAFCMKKLRHKHNMTQGDIVRATGLERGYVSNLEAGKIKHPRIETIARVAGAFGMKFSDFVLYCESLHSEFPPSYFNKK